MTVDKATVTVIGGTGSLGSGLARGFAKAGYPVVIGSRDRAKAEAMADRLAAEIGAGAGIRGMENVAAARAGDVVISAVPFASQEATLVPLRAALSGKIVIETAVPLRPPKVARVQLPEEGSAAVRAQKLLGDDVTVVSAFHTVAAHRLAEGSANGDVLVFGDSRKTRDRVVELVSALGMRGVHGGALQNAAAAEAMTSVLIFINRLYGIPGAGLAITGDLGDPKD